MPQLSKCWNSFTIFNPSFFYSCSFGKNKFRTLRNQSDWIITLKFRYSKWGSSIYSNTRILCWLNPKFDIQLKSRIHYGLLTFFKLSLPLSYWIRSNGNICFSSCNGPSFYIQWPFHHYRHHIISHSVAYQSVDWYFDVFEE